MSARARPISKRDLEWEYGTGPDTIFEDKIFLSGHVLLQCSTAEANFAKHTCYYRCCATPLIRLPPTSRGPVAWLTQTRKSFFTNLILIPAHSNILGGAGSWIPGASEEMGQRLIAYGRAAFLNCQVRYLDDRAPTDYYRATQFDLQMAIRNLQIFDLIGRSDRVSSFLTKVAEKMHLVLSDSHGCPRKCYENKVRA